MPYRLSLVRADISDRETAAALYTLRSTANAADRKVLWLSVSDDAATTARTAELADTITTIDHAHQQVSDQQWALPPGAIVIIDNPADAEPHQLAAIANHAAAADARVIIIDPATSHGASSPALRLLTHTAALDHHPDRRRRRARRPPAGANPGRHPGRPARPHPPRRAVATTAHRVRHRRPRCARRPAPPPRPGLAHTRRGPRRTRPRA